MFNVCPACGIYSAEKGIQPATGWEAYALCPACGHPHLFLRLPLFVITGPSGAGKSALAQVMAAQQTGPARAFIHMESDILWRSEFNHPEDNYHDYRNLWLRMCKNIGQAGRPVMLYGSVTPDQFDPCVERRYFHTIFTLALVCEPDTLEKRLQGRPSWRQSGSAEFVQRMQQFNAWFIENTGSFDPPMALIDTTHISLEETVRVVLDWAAERWASTGAMAAAA